MAETAPEYAWFFRAEFPMVLRTVFLILGDQGKAEDVTQEAFIQLLSHWRKVSRYERPEAWVRRVAIRLAVKARGASGPEGRLRERRRPHSRRGIGRPTPTWRTRCAAVREATSMRAALLLEDRPIAEIVEILGISEGSVKTHLHRARQRLATSSGRRWTRMRLERRIREGAERNTAVLQPDVERSLAAVVHEARRRRRIRRGFFAAIVLPAVVAGVVLGPDVLGGIPDPRVAIAPIRPRLLRPSPLRPLPPVDVHQDGVSGTRRRPRQWADRKMGDRA